MPKISVMAVTKASVAPSSYHIDTRIGGSMVRLNSISRMPRMRAIMEKCIQAPRRVNQKKPSPTWNRRSTSGIWRFFITNRMT